MSEATPCVHGVMKDFNKGVGSGLETEGLSFVGNAIFCDRSKCIGSYDTNERKSHGECNVSGLPEEGTEAAPVPVHEELSEALVRRETVPNQTLIQLGFIVVRAAEMLSGPFLGTKHRAEIREQQYNA